MTTPLNLKDLVEGIVLIHQVKRNQGGYLAEVKRNQVARSVQVVKRKKETFNYAIQKRSTKKIYVQESSEDRGALVKGGRKIFRRETA
jgi:transcriptional regulator CtsR